MNVRLPSVRHPHSFYDVFGVIATAVAIMALVLAVRYSSVVRLEMVVFMAIVFLWVGWAVHGILEQSGTGSSGDSRFSRNRRPR
ncbi:hypothetical protein CP556_17950 [Natrinema sp. CBA1119]|uniref:hypothetical protein n=1 Tax=Natrinema sp. CBA1119 TaxID=1608465 RepID=UPI000BF3993B|nr:hypothetical protein [Natrinema sp. CBA1119]PGF17796.1 hypothetical protein CP556_17950 [Natrinema sp. CBA1119]